MSEYLKQAEDLLEKLDVTLTTEFVSHRPYFQDDTESRDVYMVLLTRRNSSMSFLFGQSIANEGVHPNAYDVLAGLDSQIYPTFEDFCGKFGYDTDSRKAYTVWTSVNELAEKLQKLFTPDELSLLSEIQ